jgi:predicted helicase
MEIENLYIYIRHHEIYEKYNVVKLGITTNIAERDMVYATGEIKRGKYELVTRIIKFNNRTCNKKDLLLLEKIIQYNFTKYNFVIDGGKEFYKADIITLILPFLDKLNIIYSILTTNEIDRLMKIYKLKTIKQKSTGITNTLQKWIDRLQKHKKTITIYEDTNNNHNNNDNNNIIINPKPYQSETLEKIKDYYNQYDIGRIIWACGLGKTFLALYTVKLLKCKKILFGVPSIYLQKQLNKEIKKLFPDSKILNIGGNNTNDLITIQKFIKEYEKETKFIITTYSSSYILTGLDNNYIFDLKIADECHHLVCLDSNITSFKSYIRFHHILSTKTLFMTATAKIIYFPKYLHKTLNYLSNDDYDNNSIYSMDDEMKFGKIIDTKSIKWAIDEGKITDYKVLVLYNTITEIREIIRKFKINTHINTLINTSGNINNIENNDKLMELFVSAYMTLKSMKKYSDLTHILIYTNTTQNSDLIYEFIKLIITSGMIAFNTDELYYKSLHSNTDSGNINLDNEIKKLQKARYGIISCVYIFGEGFDCSILNGATFAENMNSPIRLTQCAMRPNRLNKELPQKIAYIIIPYLDMEECGIYNNSFTKCFNILDQLRNNDENIEHKLTVGSIQNQAINYNTNQSISINSNNSISINSNNSISINSNNSISINTYCNSENVSGDCKYWMLNIIENNDELEKLKIRLKYSWALRSKQSPEKDEYDFIKLLNKELKINNRNDYFNDDIKIKHKHWIPNPETYFTKYNIWINWYDFLNIDTSLYCKTITEWRLFIQKNNIIITSLDDYKEKSKKYCELPDNPSDFYKNFRDIFTELGIRKIRR